MGTTSRVQMGKGGNIEHQTATLGRVEPVWATACSMQGPSHKVVKDRGRNRLSKARHRTSRSVSLSHSFCVWVENKGRTNGKGHNGS